MNKPQPVITTLRLRTDVARSVADAVFLEALLATGVARWRAWAMYAAVRVFGDKKETDGVQ